MRLAKVMVGGRTGLAIDTANGVKVSFGDASSADLDALVAAGGDALHAAGVRTATDGEIVAVEDLTFLPPLVKAPSAAS